MGERDPFWDTDESSNLSGSIFPQAPDCEKLKRPTLNIPICTMPGIAGFVVPQRADHHRDMLQQMIGSMNHEAFYSSGTYEEPTLGTCAGWVCHKGSYADCLPIWNESRDICLLFVGEHYADPDESMRL